MSYYSYFSMTITGGEVKNINNIIEDFGENSGYYFYKVNDWEEDDKNDCREFAMEEVQWHSWKEDLKNLSTKYPEYSFYVIRYGENFINIDIEIAIIQNGNIITEKVKPKYPLWIEEKDVEIFNKMFSID